MSETFQYVRRRKHIKSANPFSNRYILSKDIYVPESNLYLGAWIQRVNDYRIWKIVAQHKEIGNRWIRMCENNTCHLMPNDVENWGIANPINTALIEKNIKDRIENVKHIVGEDKYIWV